MNSYYKLSHAHIYPQIVMRNTSYYHDDEKEPIQQKLRVNMQQNDDETDNLCSINDRSALSHFKHLLSLLTTFHRQ